MTVIVTRPYDGISLNAGQREVLHESEKELTFPNEASAREFLNLELGWPDDEIQDIGIEFETVDD